MRALVVPLALLASFTCVDRASSQEGSTSSVELERALQLLQTDNAQLRRRLGTVEQELDAADRTRALLSARSDELEQAVHHQSALVANVMQAFNRDGELPAQAIEARRAREAAEYWRGELAQKRVAHAVSERRLQVLRGERVSLSQPAGAPDHARPLPVPRPDELARQHERRQLQIELAEAAKTDSEGELELALERAIAAESDRDDAYAAETRAVMTAATLSRSDTTARGLTRAGAIILGFALVVLFALIAVSVSATKGRVAAEKAIIAKHAAVLEPDTIELLQALASCRAALPLAQTIFGIACWIAGTAVVGLGLLGAWLIVRQGGIDFVVARELLGGVVVRLGLAVTAVLGLLCAVVARLSARLATLRRDAWDRRLIVLEPERVLDYEMRAPSKLNDDPAALL